MQPKWMTWTGRVLSALPALMLLFSGVMKFRADTAMLAEVEQHMGITPAVLTIVAVLEVTVAFIYAIPQTAVLGAILIAGYMGGAMMTHLRVNEPPFVQFMVGVVAWAGIWLREPRLRALLPIIR